MSYDVKEMESATIFFCVLYGIAFVILFVLVRDLFGKETPNLSPIVIDQRSWWPWSTTPYLAWPYWSGWYAGGKDGGYSAHSVPIIKQHVRPWGSHSRIANPIINK